MHHHHPPYSYASLTIISIVCPPPRTIITPAILSFITPTPSLPLTASPPSSPSSSMYQNPASSPPTLSLSLPSPATLNFPRRPLPTPSPAITPTLSLRLHHHHHCPSSLRSPLYTTIFYLPSSFFILEQKLPRHFRVCFSSKISKPTQRNPPFPCSDHCATLQPPLLAPTVGHAAAATLPSLRESLLHFLFLFLYPSLVFFFFPSNIFSGFNFRALSLSSGPFLFLSLAFLFFPFFFFLFACHASYLSFFFLFL